MKNVIVILFVFPFLFVIGCKKEGSGSCFKGAKENGAKSLNIQNFNSIALYDDINLEVQFGNNYEVELTGPKNLLEYCNIELKGQTLIAENFTKCYVTKGYDFSFKLKVTIPKLDSIYTDGYGNINFLDTLNQQTFKLENFGTAGVYKLLLNTSNVKIAHHLGSADIMIIGNSNTGEFFLGSNGRIDASNLYAKQAFVNHDGDGNVYTYASDYLSYSLTSYGDLYTYGNPKIIEGTRKGKGNFFEP